MGSEMCIRDRANNHQGDVEHGLRIVSEMGRIAGRRGIQAAVKLQYRDLDTFIHPNYAGRHEPAHLIAVNAGPVVKHNANVRYATDASGEALVATAARSADVPLQHFVTRGDMPCGSTIGPVTASRLGITTVDVGVAQLSMHSAREMCGAHDPALFVALLRELLLLPTARVGRAS